MEQRVLSAEGFNVFLRKVFMWMFLGLLLTAATAFIVASNVNLAISISSMIMVFVIAELALVFTISRRVMKMKKNTTIALFLLYSVINGLTLSSIFFVYNLGTIWTAFLTASTIFAVMALYGYVTKTDLSKFSSILFGGLIAIIIGSFINMFIGSSALGYIITLVGIVIFTALIAYDMQKMKSYYAMSVQSGNANLESNLAVSGALSLYLDFINLFLMLLRLFGGRD